MKVWQRGRHRERPRAATATSNAPDLEAHDDVLADVLDVLPVGVVAFDGAGQEIVRNRQASSPTGDLQADVLVADALNSLLALARASDGAAGPWRDAVELYGPPRRSVELTVHRTAGGVVAVVEDVSERRRVDVLRRDFVDNVNHELRTPIGAIGVLLDALDALAADAPQGEPDREATARLLARMRREVTRAQSLVEDLLELSRIEQASDTATAPVAVAEIVDAAVASVEAVAERAQVRIEVHEPITVVVPGDRTQLVSAVSNLLDNAVKYSDAGSSVEVFVQTDGDTVDIVVRDHGHGIPSRDLDRIFERFYRVSRARDRQTGGTGLGLAIVRHVALNHHGEVTVSSVEGEGSTFTLRLKAVG